MADERHGLAACVYVDGVKFENASGWSLGIAGEECEIVRFEDTWKQLLRGVLAGAGSITAYHDQEAKILAELAQSSTTKALILYPDCTDDSTYYTFDAWFDFEHTADVGSCQGQTSPFRVDGDIDKVGFECVLLKDAFSVAEAAPIVSPHICMPGPGQLVIDEAIGGDLSTAGGELVWPRPAAPAWGDFDFYALTDAGIAYVRELGQVLKFRVAVTTADEVLFGYSPDITPTDEVSFDHVVRALAASTGFDVHWGASSSPTLKEIWPALGLYAQIAMVLSPFDVNGVHWYPATALSSLYGAHYLFRDESEDYPHTRLAWYTNVEHTEDLYPAWSNQDSAGIMSYCVIPCDTFETPLLIPGLVDTFTTGDGALAAHDPDYECETAGWTEHDGSWTVGSGVVTPDANVPAHAFRVGCRCDKWVQATCTANADTLDIGLTLRESANTAGGHNAWTAHFQCNVGGDDTWLDEYRNGVVTNRVASDLDIWVTNSDPQVLRARLHDEEITVYVGANGETEILHYASAWFNKHATWHGLYTSGNAAATFDQVLTLPVGSGLISECFDSFPDAENLNIHVTDEGALTWMIDVGTWADDGAEASPDATADAWAHVISTAPNAWVDARCWLPSPPGDWVGLAVRGSAASGGGDNYWYCAITEDAGVDQQIVEVRDGAHTIRASADIDETDDAYYDIAVRCRDNDIRMWVNGGDELGYASAGWNNDAVWHGLYSDDSTDAKFDQFRVTKINDYGELDATVDAIS